MGSQMPGIKRRRALLATPAFLACPRAPAAEMPLRLIEDFPIVPGSLAGRPVSWLVDTGAQGMLIVPALAEALGLPFSGMTRVYGTGGSTLARVVHLPGLRLGGVAMPDQVAPVIPLPGTLTADPPLAGLLGASLLSLFNLDFDLPTGRIALWSQDCPAPRGLSVPMELSPAREVLIPVRANGQPLLAVLDTGSRATILSVAAARRLRLDAPVSANTAAGVDGARLPVGHSRMQLALGDESPVDTPVSIAPLQLDRGDLLLGLDQLGRRRFWIGYAAGVVVFAAR